jgi:hypothetical protein
MQVGTATMVGSLLVPWPGGQYRAYWSQVPQVGRPLSGLAPSGRVRAIIFAGLAATFTVAVYLWTVRNLLKDLPFGPRLTRVLSAIGRLPTADGAH